jgi:hypothetical protein
MTLPTRAGYKEASRILPPDEQTLFLRTLLVNRADAQVAWQEWKNRSGNPITAIAAQKGPIKRFLPMLHAAVTQFGDQSDRALLTCLRTANFYEELRSNSFIPLCAAAIGALQRSGIRPIALRGVALSEAFYTLAKPRHCHDLDVYVEPEDIEASLEQLNREGFCTRSSLTRYGGTTIVTEHAEGLSVQLHDCFFAEAMFRISSDQMCTRAKSIDIGGIKTAVLADHDQLLHVIGHAASAPGRTPMIWACDAWHIIEKSKQLDWEIVVSNARLCHLPSHLAVALTYLAQALDATVPESVIKSLDSSLKNDNVQRVAYRFCRSAHRVLCSNRGNWHANRN